VFLETVFRQTDLVWINHLARIARGKVDEKVLDYLEGLRRELPQDKVGIKPTKLYSHRKKVDEENAEELAKLPGNGYSFHSVNWKAVYRKEVNKELGWGWVRIEDPIWIDPEDHSHAGMQTETHT